MYKIDDIPCQPTALKYMRHPYTAPNFKRPYLSIITAHIGQGKSNLMECLATNFPPETVIIDLLGARDDEGIAWCRSPYDKVLLLHDNFTDVRSSWNTAKAEDLTLPEINKYEVLIAAYSGFADDKTHALGITSLIDLLYKKAFWNEPWVVLIRESKRFMYSRMGLGEGEHRAKAELSRFFTEQRHSGNAVIADSIREYDIDKSFRMHAYHHYIKALGSSDLPDELHYLYHYVSPAYLSQLPIDRFIYVGGDRAISEWGVLQVPWHKEEHEDIKTIVGIKIDRGEAVQDVVESRIGRRKKVTYDMHLKILELHRQKCSLGEIAVKMTTANMPISKGTCAIEVQLHKAQGCECFKTALKNGVQSPPPPPPN